MLRHLSVVRNVKNDAAREAYFTQFAQKAKAVEGPAAGAAAEAVATEEETVRKEQ